MSPDFVEAMKCLEGKKVTDVLPNGIVMDVVFDSGHVLKICEGSGSDEPQIAIIYQPEQFPESTF